MGKHSQYWIITGFLLPVIIFQSCVFLKKNIRAKSSHCEVIIYSISFYDPYSNKYLKNQGYWPDHKIWYKDSLVIQEITGLHLYDSTGAENRWVSIEFYTFIDLRTKSFYDFKSFSDTATLIKKYTQADSTPVFGGWNFYWPRNRYLAPLPSLLPDTMIDGIQYKRIKMIEEIRDTEDQMKEKIFLGYLRCDKKNTIFMFEKLLSQRFGCPMVRIDQQQLLESGLSGHSPQIEFISDTLTVAEEKIFRAWEKYAQKNPVK